LAAAILTLALVTSGTMGCLAKPPQAVNTRMASDALNIIPPGWQYLMYWDVNQLRELETRYNASNPMDWTMEKYMGIDYRLLNRFLIAEIDESAGMALLEGRFDTEKIKGKLLQYEGFTYLQTEYRGIEIWAEVGGDRWGALTPEHVIDGNEETVRNAVDLMKDGGPSLADDPELGEMLAYLPQGFCVMAAKGKSGFFPYEDEGWDGLEVTALSHTSDGNGTVGITVVHRFKDQATAHDYVDTVEDSLAGGTSFHSENIYSAPIKLESYRVSQNREFIRVDAVANAAHYFGYADTSTPESTIREFFDAEMALDATKAANCVAGEQSMEIMWGIGNSFRSQRDYSLEVSNLEIVIIEKTGTHAIAELSLDIRETFGGKVRERHVDDTMELVKEGNRWLLQFPEGEESEE